MTTDNITPTTIAQRVAMDFVVLDADDDYDYASMTKMIRRGDLDPLTLDDPFVDLEGAEVVKLMDQLVAMVSDAIETYHRLS